MKKLINAGKRKLSGILLSLSVKTKMKIKYMNEEKEVKRVIKKCCPKTKQYKSIRTWRELSRHPLPENLIREAKDFLDWKDVSHISVLSEEFIREFKDYVNWYWISACQNLSESFIEEFQDKVNWHNITSGQNVSYDFIWNHRNEVDWDFISVHYRMPEEFIEKAKEYIDWGYASRYQFLSEKNIENNCVDWYTVSKYQKLSESFIRKYQDCVDWECISKYQKLSESFIREFKDKVNWFCVSQYQPLSEDFICEFKYEVIWHEIARCQVVSEKFLKEFGYELNNNSDKLESYWERKIRSTGLYECHEDFFYAYKGIRSDRYSAYNFQYRYLPGETYECFSDYSDFDNTFGLSAWTKEKAEVYCDELVVKVKIYYKDVTAVVCSTFDNTKKIRCRRLTVLE